ncbi:MAG TPA: GNAT family N-acetyltransferase [Jatrophihabitantaceae bacterium]|nr:GNAT family N-acetyltransferase [Jatrophihabitantaceae bacterium]
MIQVRPAEARDGDALGEIHAAAWEAAYAPMFQPDFAARAVESRRGRWHQRIAEGTGSILVAELDGRPLVLSFCVSSSTRPGLAEIYSFYGHPDGWGSGAAAALMTETLRSLHDNGYAEVHLWTLRSTAQSRRFYTKCGFTESGVERTYDFGDGRPFGQLEYRRLVGSR